MKKVTGKAIGFVVELIERHVERLIAMRVFDGRRVDYGLKH